MADDNLLGFRMDVTEALNSMEPTNIQWPGGNMDSIYKYFLMQVRYSTESIYIN